MRTSSTSPTNAPAPLPDGNPDSMWRSGLIAFKYRNYRLFWFGQLVSVTGTWMQTLAQSYLVYDVLNASPFQLGLVSTFQFLPLLFLGIPAGLVADRLPKRSLLVATQSSFAVLAMVLLALIVSDRVQLWHVYLVAGLFGITNAFDMPTRQAFVSEMVGKEAVMNAIALNSALFNTARLIGPAAAGAILAVFGPSVCFGINAVSYLAVIVGLLMMTVIPRKIPLDTASPLTKLKEGLRYVRATPTIFRTVVLVGVVGMFGINFNVWIPMLASDSFDSGASAYGLLFAAMGAGSLLGALTLAFFGRKPNRTRMLGMAIALGLAEVVLGIAAAIPTSIVIGMMFLGLAGFTSSMATSTANTTVQTASRDEYRGRVMAVYMTVFAGTTPFGSLLVGFIAGHGGPPMAVTFGGAVTAIGAIAVAFMQRQRRQPLADGKTLASGGGTPPLVRQAPGRTSAAND